MRSQNKETPLAGFGVQARGDRLYRVVLREGPSTVHDLALRLGWENTDVVAELRTLVDLGLVVVRGGAVSTVTPHLALGRLVERESRKITERAHRLDTLRAAIDDYTAEQRDAEAVAGTIQPLEVFAGTAVAPVIDSLIRSTHGPIRLVHPLEWFDDPGWSKFDSLLPWEIQGGRAAYAIYPAEVLDRPDAVDVVHTFAEMGENVRVMPNPPSRFVVLGRGAAIVPLEWGRTPLHRVVLRNPGMVDAFALLFDMLWRSAVPLPVAVDALTDTESVRRQITKLLAVGAKDETIARHLGVSLRTVRRRIAEMLDELGTTTRFQAGAEAVRRHLV